jgi:hypothetical protein
LQVLNLTRQEVIDRRNASIERFHKNEEAMQKQARDNAFKQEKAVIDNQMEVERH